MLHPGERGRRLQTKRRGIVLAVAEHRETLADLVAVAVQIERIDRRVDTVGSVEEDDRQVNPFGHRLGVGVFAVDVQRAGVVDIALSGAVREGDRDRGAGDRHPLGVADDVSGGQHVHTGRQQRPGSHRDGGVPLDGNRADTRVGPASGLVVVGGNIGRDDLRIDPRRGGGRIDLILDSDRLEFLGCLCLLVTGDHRFARGDRAAKPVVGDKRLHVDVRLGGIVEILAPRGPAHDKLAAVAHPDRGEALVAFGGIVDQELAPGRAGRGRGHVRGQIGIRLSHRVPGIVGLVDIHLKGLHRLQGVTADELNHQRPGSLLVDQHTAGAVLIAEEVLSRIRVFVVIEGVLEVGRCSGENRLNLHPLHLVLVSVLVEEGDRRAVPHRAVASAERDALDGIRPAERHTLVIEPAAVDAPAVAILSPALPDDHDIAVGIHRHRGVLLIELALDIDPVGTVDIVEPEFLRFRETVAVGHTSAAGCLQRVTAGKDVARHRVGRLVVGRHIPDHGEVAGVVDRHRRLLRDEEIFIGEAILGNIIVVGQLGGVPIRSGFGVPVKFVLQHGAGRDLFGVADPVPIAVEEELLAVGLVVDSSRDNDALIVLFGLGPNGDKVSVGITGDGRRRVGVVPGRFVQELLGRVLGAVVADIIALDLLLRRVVNFRQVLGSGVVERQRQIHRQDVEVELELLAVPISAAVGRGAVAVGVDRVAGDILNPIRGDQRVVAAGQLKPLFEGNHRLPEVRPIGERLGIAVGPVDADVAGSARVAARVRHREGDALDRAVDQNAVAKQRPVVDVVDRMERLVPGGDRLEILGEADHQVGGRRGDGIPFFDHRPVGQADLGHLGAGVVGRLDHRPQIDLRTSAEPIVGRVGAVLDIFVRGISPVEHRFLLPGDHDAAAVVHPDRGIVLVGSAIPGIVLRHRVLTGQSRLVEILQVADRFVERLERIDERRFGIAVVTGRIGDGRIPDRDLDILGIFPRFIVLKRNVVDVLRPDLSGGPQPVVLLVRVVAGAVPVVQRLGAHLGEVRPPVAENPHQTAENRGGVAHRQVVDHPGERRLVLAVDRSAGDQFLQRRPPLRTAHSAPDRRAVEVGAVIVHTILGVVIDRLGQAHRDRVERFLVVDKLLHHPKGHLSGAGRTVGESAKGRHRGVVVLLQRRSRAAGAADRPEHRVEPLVDKLLIGELADQIGQVGMIGDRGIIPVDRQIDVRIVRPPLEGDLKDIVVVLEVSGAVDLPQTLPLPIRSLEQHAGGSVLMVENPNRHRIVVTGVEIRNGVDRVDNRLRHVFGL